MRYLRQFACMGRRWLPAVFVIALFASAVPAYTLVMRDGRRVEIPNQFSVTETTLTYEVSPGFQVTVQIASIDLAATEKANGERPGALLNRARMVSASPVAPEKKEPAKRSVSNRELDRYARARQESEVEYEKRRKELGLPSIEESRLRQRAEAESIRQELAERRSAEVESESYWRGRASELRTEMGAVDAEITFVRTRLGEVWVSNTFIGVAPIGFGSFDHGFRRHQRFRGFPRPLTFSAPRGSAPLTASIGFRGGPVRSRISVNPGFPVGGGFAGPLNSFGGAFPSSRVGRGHFGSVIGHAPVFGSFGNVGVIGSFNSVDLGYERTVLQVRLDELVGRQAALRARWRELEEEARRAGAPPGWLRP